MIDASASFRFRKFLGMSMMWILLLFAALPTLWVLILSLREESVIFEPFWQSPLALNLDCLLYTSPSPRDRQKSRMPSSA